MPSSPKLLLHTWDPFLISALFKKFWRHNELCYLISFSLPLCYIVQTSYWFLKSLITNFSDPWGPTTVFINWFVNNIICVCFLQCLRACVRGIWNICREHFINSCLFSVTLFLKTSKPCELEEFLLIMNCAGFVTMHLFKCCSNLSLITILSLFSLLQGDVAFQATPFLFVCCCSFLKKIKLYHLSGCLDFRIINSFVSLSPTSFPSFPFFWILW